MHLMYFTEQPMSAYPAKEADRLGYSILIFPNHYFDPKEGSRLYNERLEEYILADEVGFDGIMLNEHHNGPFCMQAKVNIFATLLAGMTKKVKIVLLGNPLPISENPIRLAEELGDDRSDLEGAAGLRLCPRRWHRIARHQHQSSVQSRALRGSLMT